MPKNPRQKRIMIAVGAAAVLALIVLMQRRGQATDPSTVPAGTITGPGSSTFADNGEQATALGNTITQGVGDLQMTAEDLATTQQGFLDQFAGLVESLRQPAEPAAAAPTAPAQVGTVATVGPTSLPSMVAAASSPTNSKSQRAASTRLPANFATAEGLKSKTHMSAGGQLRHAASMHPVVLRSPRKKK